MLEQILEVMVHISLLILLLEIIFTIKSIIKWG